MSQFTGTATVRKDGLSLRIQKASIDVGGPTREQVFADGKRVGWKKKPSASKVSGSCLHDSGSDIVGLHQSGESVTITFETDDGKTYTCTDCTSSKPPVLNNDGEYDVEFEGEPAF